MPRSSNSLTFNRRVDLLYRMKIIRAFETQSERSYMANKIGGYCHLSSGQESVTVGTTAALSSSDILVTSYRCHGFALARGIPAQNVMAELFGKADGCSGGKGGSMHLADVERNYFGGWGIVAGQLPVATGLALAAKRKAKREGKPSPVVL
jgi:pyruvate dehydrogenase E1 component alpha subunit